VNGFPVGSGCRRKGGGDQPFSVHFVKAQLAGTGPRQAGSNSDDVQSDPAALAGNGVLLAGDGNHSGSVQRQKALLHGRINNRVHSESVQSVNDFAGRIGCGRTGAGIQPSSAQIEKALLGL
jgi:hypothetical protein